MSIDRMLLLFIIGDLAAHANPDHPILSALVAIAVTYPVAVVASRISKWKGSA